MKKHSLDPNNFFNTACAFEGSLALIAMLLNWLTDGNLFVNLHFSESALALGLLATLPLVAVLFIMQELPFRAIQNIRYFLMTSLGPLLKNCHWTDLFILSCVAGISEELLFRGFLQPWLENSFATFTALLISNIIFALVHAITPLYAILALLTGIYLGMAMDYQPERNLLIPVVIHAIYDFVAFVVILRNYRRYQNILLNKP